MAITKWPTSERVEPPGTTSNQDFQTNFCKAHKLVSYISRQ